MPKRFICLEVVLDRVCLSKSQIYRKIHTGEFPQPVPLGPQKVAFLEADLRPERKKRAKRGAVLEPRKPGGHENDQACTTRQVAQMTGFSLKSLEAMRHRRKGPPYLKVGTRVRYRADDVRAWIEQGGPVS